VLNLYPVYVAEHYGLFVCLVALGTIQAAACRAGLRGLQIGGRLWPKGIAFSAMALVWLGGIAVFVLTTPDYLSPGLAGSELIAVFGAGVVVAMALSLLGAMAGRRPREGGDENLLAGGDTVAGRACRVSCSAQDPRGLAILLPDPDLPAAAAKPLIAAIEDCGYVCASVCWGDSSVPLYPDCLALVPMLISRELGRRPIAPVVVVGCGLAADLALRSACEDSRVQRVYAIGPALAPNSINRGLLLLREMSLVQAIAWLRRWSRAAFVVALKTEDAVARLGGRATIVVSMADGYFVPNPDALALAEAKGAYVETLPSATHYRLATEVGAKRLLAWLGG